MKICPNCGTSVNDDATFCNNCGASLNSVTPVADAAKDTPSMAPASQPEASAQAAPGNAPIQDGTIHQAPLAPPVMQQNFQQGAFGQPQGQPYMQQPYFDPKDHTAEFDPKDIADNKLFAVVPYFFSFIAGVIVGIYVNDSLFLKFHVKNALRLDIASILAALLFIIPILGWVAGGVCLAILAVVKIIAIVHAFSGKAKDLPIISGIKFLK